MSRTLMSGGHTDVLLRFPWHPDDKLFVLSSCMKTLSHLLLEVQLRDPDELTVSPLRTFATEILVRKTTFSIYSTIL